MDIFFIDWESPRTYRHNQRKPVLAASPWRRLYIANELNELQSEKHINTQFVLIMFMLLAEGFNWKNLSYVQTNLSTAHDDNAIDSFVLRFCVITGTVFLVGLLQYIVATGAAFANPPSYLEFVDLCSVANMSVIMFNEDLKGYYIHGKSPSGSADVDARQLRLNLMQEAAGNANIRGIHPKFKDQQTFELSVPKAMA